MSDAKDEQCRRHRLVGASVLIALMCLPLSGEAGNKATNIVSQGERAMRGLSSQALVKMSIYRPSFIRRLTLRTWSRGKNETLVEILEPVKETGVGSLRISNRMWNYLPQTDRTVRIPSSMMLQSWMGSDFTNDDLVKASSLSRDYHHRIVKFSGRGKNRRVLIKCTPKKGAPVVWGAVMHWARLRDSLPVKQQFYDERGKLVRTLYFSRHRRMDDRVVPTRITLQKADSPKEMTRVDYVKILYDRVIPSRFFSRNRLRTTVEEGKNLSRGWSLRKMRTYGRRLAHH